MEILIRPVTTRSEEQLSLDIYNAVWPFHTFTMADVDSFKETLIAHADHLALLEGEPVGSSFVSIQPQRPDIGRVELTVLPAHRRRGVGSTLYDAVSTWCAAHGIDVIEAPVEAEDGTSLAFAQRRGFVEIERSVRMVLDLADVEPPPIAPPDGVEILTWAERPELAAGMYEVAVEAYADEPGAEDEVMEPFEDWLAHDMRGAADRPEATFVALAGNEVVGYAKFHLSSAEPGVAYHDMTGVKRAWRGQGIAGALKRAQVAWAKREGYERLATSPELRNEPSRRMNARLGYRPIAGRALMRGPLARTGDSGSR